MSNESIAERSTSPTLPAAQVYGMAAICLVIGLGIGYMFRDSQMPASPAQIAGSAASPAGGGAVGGQAPSTAGAMGQAAGGPATQGTTAPTRVSAADLLAEWASTRGEDIYGLPIVLKFQHAIAQ